MSIELSKESHLYHGNLSSRERRDMSQNVQNIPLLVLFHASQLVIWSRHSCWNRITRYTPLSISGIIRAALSTWKNTCFRARESFFITCVFVTLTKHTVFRSRMCQWRIKWLCWLIYWLRLFISLRCYHISRFSQLFFKQRKQKLLYTSFSTVWEEITLFSGLQTHLQRSILQKELGNYVVKQNVCPDSVYFQSELVFYSLKR